ncbi:MAG: alpha/beta fold hydrolase [Gemmatimonadaceae bacterium]|nr:alpha/beta fold hydrolase [Gemmatimonadaceae bacterium]
MLGWLVLPALAGVGAAWRRLASRRIEARYAERTTLAADGVVPGAASFTLTGTNGRALLLLHGSGDSPQTLRYLGERLNAAGFTVHAPLLPGHGRSPRDFAQVTAVAYLAAARAALDTLRARHGWIGVAGLSMGGALATQLAAEAADVRVLVLMAPYLAATPQVAWATRTAPVWGLVQPYVDARGGLSVHDPVARAASYAYGVVAPRALRALLDTAAKGRAALAQVTVPTLVIHSRADNRIPEATVTETMATLRAPTERHWVTGCGHVITVDYCKDTVANLVLAFLARHAG